ncbi:MAG: TraM recognition domain-containing protein [Patescibacteria group bacterium]|nr:TraM recognition domain-containing protein [Patescibacteria group bacterium]
MYNEEDLINSSSPAPVITNQYYGSLIGLSVFVFIIIICLIIIKIIRHNYRKQKHFIHTILQIRLPHEIKEEDERRDPKEYLRHEIAKSETIIEAIGGLRAERGFKAWLEGRNDVFSLEIVAQNGLIDFYLATPEHQALYVEKQIHAHYPDASVIKVKDYNIFRPSNVIAAGMMMTTRIFVLPIKTYLKEDVDSLNSILNVLSKLDDNEAMAIQLVVRSAKKSWHQTCSTVVKRAYRNNSLTQALKYNKTLAVFNFVGQMFASSEIKKRELEFNAKKQITDMEREVIKSIEEKNSKAGLDVNVRIVVSSPYINNAERFLYDAASSFAQYNYFDYGNNFLSAPLRHNEHNIISDFIHRRFNDNNSFLLNTEEITSLFHLPLVTAETPSINWLESKQAAAPVQTPKQGLILGYNEYRGERQEIKIKTADRLRHMYMVGKSGVGKSVLLANMAIQDAINGDGFCVLDPHGDLVDDILERIPANRINDVICFSPADMARPMGLNLLEYDPRYPEQKTFVINEMIGIFDKLYDLKSTGGPIFEQYMRNAMLLIMSDPESGSTLLEIPRVLSDADFRNAKLDRCNDATVVNFWINEAAKAGGDAALANIVPYITSKLTTFISNDIMRPIIGQQNSAFNLREIMDSKKILLVSLPKGVIGELNAHLLGMILVGKILMAALSRADNPQSARNPFYLYIDEFQNFTTDSITQVLSEARKYGLGLILAHQYIGQLSPKGNTAIKEAVFGNVGSIISFKVGPEDAEFLEKAFKPEFSVTDLMNVDKYTAFVRLLIDNMNARAFTMQTPWPLFGQSDKMIAQQIKENSRIKYGVERELVEAEIRLRSQAF